MNVIIVNDFAFVNGGAGQIGINLARKLTKFGDKVILFAAVGPIENELLQINNLEIICLNQYDILHDPSRVRAAIQGVWNFKARKKFAELLEVMSPKETIIHIHTLQKAVSTSIVTVAKRRKFKVIYHIHDYGIACPNLGFYNYKSNTICKKNAMSLDCLLSNCDVRKFSHKCWRIVRQYMQNGIGGLKNVDCYIYISKFSLSILKPYLKPNARLEYLPNTVDITKKPRVKVEHNNLIVYVGRLSPEKNPNILAKATRDLNKAVAFIGSGDCDVEIKELNPKAEITGWLTKGDVYQLLEKARLMVFPSKCYETQGLSVMEALAHGIPVIVSNTCAAREMIDDGYTGLLFKNDDLEALKNKILQLQDNDELKKMSENAYSAYWKNNKSDDEYIERLRKIYTKLLNVD